MSARTFPGLLSQKARPLVGLSRTHLVTLGGSYLLLSWVGVSGIASLVANALLLLILKFSEKWFRAGFFRFLLSPKVLFWVYKVEVA